MVATPQNCITLILRKGGCIAWLSLRTVQTCLVPTLPVSHFHKMGMLCGLSKIAPAHKSATAYLCEVEEHKLYSLHKVYLQF